MIYIYLVLSIFSYSVGEYFSKKWALDPKASLAFITTLAYIGGTMTWLPAILLDNRLAILGTIWCLLGATTTVVIGTVIFHEPITNIQKVGLCLTAIALICLNTK